MKELTQEQTDKLGFVPTEAELAYADQMASTVTSDLKSKKAFEGQRNRSAWKRMNRPSKTQAIDKGADMINLLITKGLKLNPVRESTEKVIESNPTANGMTGP